MARKDIDEALLPSVVDRLISPKGTDSANSVSGNLQQIFRSVRRDLEALLNARRRVVEPPEHFVETRNSVLMYGFPDISKLQASTKQGRDEICRTIESVIGQNEPRLRDVKVHIVEPKADEPQTARFAIEATLNVTPGPRVAFSTVLDLATGQASIRASEL